MIDKIRQIARDHAAMNVLRRSNGDCELVCYVSANGRSGFDCFLFQGPAQSSEEDPAEAILSAYSDYLKNYK
jgi:hypothetical protein